MSVSPTALAAIRQALQQFDQASRGIRQATGGDPETVDRVDLSSEAVRLSTAKTAFQAGIVLAKSEDELTEHVLDLLA